MKLFDSNIIKLFYKKKSNKDLLDSYCLRTKYTSKSPNYEIETNIAKDEILTRMSDEWLRINLTREQVKNLYENLSLMNENETTIPLVACYAKFDKITQDDINWAKTVEDYNKNLATEWGEGHALVDGAID